jgi:hypothetical protein
MMDRITDFWVFNANTVVLTVVCGVVWVLAHELTTIAVAGLKGWRKRVRRNA